MRTLTETLKTDAHVELAERVRAAAEADGRTVSSWVRHQLSKAVADVHGKSEHGRAQ